MSMPDLIIPSLIPLAIVCGWHLRGGVQALRRTRQRRRERERNAESIFVQPFQRDYRDEFNQLRNTFPVDDDELRNAKVLARAKPINRPF
ncbi:MAG TPA: hypothetical protein VHY22_05465 [Chthoniobacteraceae bacterium]|jgi:hypothetical protein|nr:hypothetical protein [Chthoniobacteraceae bacterium]